MQVVLYQYWKGDNLVIKRRNLLECAKTLPVDYRGVIFHLFSQYIVDESGREPVVTIGDTFRHHLFGKNERGIEPAEIKIWNLTRFSTDSRILEELEAYETALFHLLLLIDLQRKGEQKLLLTSGYPNIFYIRDMAEILWTVILSWSEIQEGWLLDARSVGSPYAYTPGSRIVSLSTPIEFVTL